MTTKASVLLVSAFFVFTSSSESICQNVTTPVTRPRDMTENISVQALGKPSVSIIKPTFELANLFEPTVTTIDFESAVFLSPARGVSLEVKASPSKASYMQGEIVFLNVEIKNNGMKDIFLKGADVKSGYLKIYIASDDQKFREYNSAGVRTTKKGWYFKMGESIKSEATVLWNLSPNERFASPNLFQESHVMSSLAFPEPGVYFVKAVLIVPGETSTKIESEMIQIIINEPVGDDARVWNKTKKNGEIAYFMQQGEVRAYKPEEREKLLSEVEQLIANNPNSFLASQIKESLEKFRVSEATRKEFMEKLKQQQKPRN